MAIYRRAAFILTDGNKSTKLHLNGTWRVQGSFQGAASPRGLLTTNITPARQRDSSRGQSLLSDIEQKLNGGLENRVHTCRGKGLNWRFKGL